MSEYMFAIRRGKKTSEDLDRVSEVIKPLGAWWNGGDIPGTGHQYWLCCDNQGSPFDQRKADEVRAALAKAGVEW